MKLFVVTHPLSTKVDLFHSYKGAVEYLSERVIDFLRTDVVGQYCHEQALKEEEPLDLIEAIFELKSVFDFSSVFDLISSKIEFNFNIYQCEVNTRNNSWNSITRNNSWSTAKADLSL